MMTVVYELWPAEGFALCHPIRSQDFETLRTLLDGTPREAMWQSPPMELVRTDGRKALAESDFPWLGAYALVLDKRAAKALDDLIRADCELLPLACEDADLVVLNATRVIDALREDASDIVRFSSGRIMDIKRAEFLPGAVANVDIFKIPNLRSSPLYVSHRFVTRVQDAGLRGLVFKEVWRG